MTNKSEYIFGRNPVIEYLRSGKRIEKIWLQKGVNWEGMPEIRKYANESGTPVQLVPYQKLNQMVKGNHQGIVIQAALVEYLQLQQLIDHVYEKGEDPFFIVLDGVTDTRNLGGIARTALCSGAHGIVISEKGVARIHGETVKSSAGAILQLPVVREKNIDRILEILRENGIPAYGTAAKTKKNMYQMDFKKPVAIVMGDEESGISPVSKEKCDDWFSIPMPGDFDSLNVGVATAVVAYEVVRQRGGFN